MIVCEPYHKKGITMEASEAIIGMGSQAALELLELSELDEKSSNMVGPEFTYLGVFLSALAYKEVNDLRMTAGVVGLNSLRLINNQAEESDIKMLNTIAGLSLAAYDEAITTWPRANERVTVAVTLCDLLARLLKSSAKIELTVMQKAKLRAKVADMFEVLELAHREMHNAGQSNDLMHSDAKNSKSANLFVSPLEEIQASKSDLLNQFDEGDITGKEYQQGLEAINKRELAINLEIAKNIYANSNLWDKKFFVVVALTFLIGILIGTWL